MAYSPTVVRPYRSSKLDGTGSGTTLPWRPGPPVPMDVPTTLGVDAYVITAQFIRPAAMAVAA